MSDTGLLKITLVKSTIGFDRKQAIVVQSIGLRRIGHSVELRDTPETRGMIHKVRHLVTVVASARDESGRASASGG
jgi:large subunit ribosomal protein L30